MDTDSKIVRDATRQVRSMGWVLAYGVANAAYPIVTKLVIRSNSLTAWGRTYYNNLMTFLVFAPVAILVGDVGRLGTLQAEGAVNTAALGMLVLSCVWGTAISFLGFLVRLPYSSPLQLTLPRLHARGPSSPPPLFLLTRPLPR
jgi:hypothetical protein